MSKLFEYIDTLSSPYEAFQSNDYPVQSHWHYYMEVICMYSGKVSVNCDKSNYILEKGDIFIFCPKSIHSIKSIGTEEFKYGVLKFDVSKLAYNLNPGISLRLLFESAAIDDKVSLHFKNEDIADLHLNELFLKCEEEINKKEYGYDLVVHSYLSELLISLVRIMKNNGFDTDNAASSTAPTTTLETITEYIDMHSAEKLNIAEVASLCNMSYSYFAKSFHQMYGRSCKDYLEFVRVSKAENLLLYTNMDLTYISLETGFSDCSHLIKTFKKWKGITPKQFRLKHKQ